jgi:predicted aspartyl protease
MIAGRVNAQREAIISVVVYGRINNRNQLDAVLDTGFNHDLTLPSDQVRALGLEYAAPAQVSLAGDVQAYSNYYRATIVWDGSEREVTAPRWWAWGCSKDGDLRSTRYRAGR